MRFRPQTGNIGYVCGPSPTARLRSSAGHSRGRKCTPRSGRFAAEAPRSDSYSMDFASLVPRMRNDATFSEARMEEKTAAFQSVHCDDSLPQPLPTYAPQFRMTSSEILARHRASIEQHTVPRLTLELFPAGNLKREWRSVENMPSQEASSAVVSPQGCQPPDAADARLSGPDAFGGMLRYPHSVKKQKRESNTARVDFAQNTVPFPFPSPDIRHDLPTSSSTKASGEGVTPQCVECGLRAGEAQNALLVCQHCCKMWHRECAPLEAGEGMPAEDASFSCLACEHSADTELEPSCDELAEHRHLLERFRKKRLSSLPAGVFAADPRLLGFQAGQASAEERAEYFSRKKPIDLLNILSFCDQLEPQLIVDMMVSVSTKHPNLPIFGDPDWRANLPSSPASVPSCSRNSMTAQAPRAKARPRHGHILHPKSSRRIKGGRRNVKRMNIVTAEQTQTAGATVPLDEDENPPPPTWPRPEEGLYATLPPEIEDRALLEDEDEGEAFSHFYVDAWGKPLTIPTCA